MTGTVLLLGADGFIGRHVALALRDAGFTPFCIARRPAALAAQGFATLRVDLAATETHRRDFWTAHASNAVGVVNAAGLLDASDAAFQAVHVDAPRALYDALPDGARIVLISAIGIGAETPFARYRRAGEALLEGRRATILRPGLVMGDTSYGGTSLLRALAVFPWRTPVVGTGDQPVNPMHAADLADLCLGALRGEISGGPHDAGGAETLTQAELTARLRAWMGQSAAPAMPVPLPLARIAGRIGSALSLGPVSRNAVAQLEAGIVSRPSPETTTSPVSAFLTARPSGTQDLWHARLYLLRPLVRLILAMLWLVSGLLGLFLPATAVLASIDTALPDTLALVLGRAGGVLDLGIAGALLLAWRLRALFWLQLGTIAGYTFGLTLLDPGLWLDPIGGLLKNLPILVLLLVHRVLEEER